MCSTRPIRTVGPEPLHPHVCGPHVALEVGDHLMLFTIRRRSQVPLFLARVGRTCTQTCAVCGLTALNVISREAAKVFRISALPERTRTRANTNPSGKEADAAVRSVRACVARESNLKRAEVWVGARCAVIGSSQWITKIMRN